MSHVDPKRPETWGACGCGGSGTYLVRVAKSPSDEDATEPRVGDYTSVDGPARYFLVCDGCKVLADACDRVLRLAFARAIRDRDSGG